MKIGKPKSKRTPVRLRHKIEKASAAKQKKNRKLAKKDPTWRSRVKKDPGIPNLFPYKDRILAEIEEQRQAKEIETQRRREEAKALKKASSMALKSNEAMDEDSEGSDGEEAGSLIDDEEEMDEDDDQEDPSNPMAALLASARARASKYDAGGLGDGVSDEEDDTEDEPVEAGPKTDSSAKAFKHLFPEVLSAADIILYVLDARDPQSTRSIPTERQIAAHAGGSKRIVLILNKIDLVPAPVLGRWLTYLRRFHLTLPLRASSPAPNAKTYEHKGVTVRSTAETLLKALKAYASKQQLKRALTVGVVGYPNVGKSSVINALVAQLGRKKAPAPTGAEAGVTTSLRSVKLDNQLTLLDSPGVVFPGAELQDNDDDKKKAAGSADDRGPKNRSSSSSSDAHARLVLLNAVPPKAIDDPVPAVQLLLARVGAVAGGLDALQAHYGIPALLSRDGDVSADFLVHVARKRGRLGKGGVPNVYSAAMAVLADWRDGRIGAWVEPPPIDVAGVTTDKAGDVAMLGTRPPAREDELDRREIVTEWAKEFELEGLWGPGANGE